METQFYACKYCFKEFEPKRRRVQKYCSDTCRSKAYHVRQLNNTADKNNTATTEVQKPMSLPPLPSKTKIDQISLAGVGNAALGQLAVNSLKAIITSENNKPATKGDLNKLLEKLNNRYHLIKNYPPQPDGALAYFDLQTNELVFFKS